MYFICTCLLHILRKGFVETMDEMLEALFACKGS
jgi:hypothetical protein